MKMTVSWTKRIRTIDSSLVTLILLFLIFVFSSVVSPCFLTKQNILDTIITNVPIAFLAIGMFFPVVTGGIDLSVGSAAALSGCILAGILEIGSTWYVAIILSVLLVTAFGTISGILVGYGKVPAFIVTLGMMSILRGFAYIYQVGSPKPIYDDTVISIGEKSFFGGYLSLAVIVLLACLGGCWILLNWSSFGRRLYAIGDNIESARLCGINIPYHIVIAYALSSVFASLGGIVLSSRMMLGSALVGSGYELDAIAAVILGGASLNGGRGNIIGTVIGAYVFGFISNILNLIGIGGYPQMIIKGLVIVAALLFTQER